MIKYLWKRLCKKMSEKDGFLNFLIPALFAVGGAAAGAAKHSQDKQNYKKDIESRNRRRVFAAFTGDMPSEANAPQKPSGVGTVLGSAINFGNVGNAINPYLQGSGGQMGQLGTQPMPMPQLQKPNLYDNVIRNKYTLGGY